MPRNAQEKIARIAFASSSFLIIFLSNQAEWLRKKKKKSSTTQIKEKLTSTVGFPRLSKIWRALTTLIVAMISELSIQ